MIQTGYAGFIKLIETPDYSSARFQHEPYSIYKDPVWSTETRKKRAELERVAFYHCDQVGTPQTLSNELGECVWEIKQDTWGTALEINTSQNLLEQTNIRFQGQYYDSETGLHYNRYRYYEPFSARYVSKDPIGLFGGLNNSAYVSDPNQWVDPMGLMADKDKKDPWQTPVNASKWLKEENKYHKDIYDANQQKKNEAKASQIKYEMEQQRSKPSTGILGALLPNTMSGLAKNSNDANVLRTQGEIRNSNLALVNLAGYAAYPLATGGTAIGASPLAQVAIKGGAGSTALDAVFQAPKSIECRCNTYDVKRGAGAFVGGAVGGLYAGKMVQLANVGKGYGGKMVPFINAGPKVKNIEQVGIFNLPRNLTNVDGLKIWGTATVIGATTGQVAKSEFTDGKNIKKSNNGNK